MHVVDSIELIISRGDTEGSAAHADFASDEAMGIILAYDEVKIDVWKRSHSVARMIACERVNNPHFTPSAILRPMQRQTITLQRGDVLIMSGLFVHASSPVCRDCANDIIIRSYVALAKKGAYSQVSL